MRAHIEILEDDAATPHGVEAELSDTGALGLHPAFRRWVGFNPRNGYAVTHIGSGALVHFDTNEAKAREIMGRLDRAFDWRFHWEPGDAPPFSAHEAYRCVLAEMCSPKPPRAA